MLAANIAGRGSSSFLRALGPEGNLSNFAASILADTA